MIREHDDIVTEDLLEEGPRAGDVGDVVHIHPNQTAYDVEFKGDGQTVVATVLPSQLRAAR